MRIKAKTTAWIDGVGSFVWPEGVEVEFPNGDVYDAYGARDADGISIDYSPGGTGACGSPCHQALLAAGVVLESAEDEG